jgi:hypothetical protein
MSDRPTVLFVCVHNAGRSQIAAGYLQSLAGDPAESRVLLAPPPRPWRAGRSETAVTGWTPRLCGGRLGT